VATNDQNPEPETTSVDVNLCETVARREQFLDRVQIVAQRIAYRVRQALESDGLPGPRDADGQAENSPSG
jgi:hypothetical protein